jgi:DNA modification methylase
MRLKILSGIEGRDYEVDVRVPNRTLTEQEFKEYNIRANKNTGEFDFDILSSSFEYEDLQDWGFSDDELTDFTLDLIDDDDSGDDVVPDKPVEARSQLGDLYELGSHRVLCGDSTDKEIVAVLMNSDKADMVFTDPPYGVNYSSKNEFLNKADKGNRIQSPIINDNIDDYIGFFKKFLSVICFADYNSFYITISGQKLLCLLTAIKELNLKMSQILVWAKNNHVLGRQDYFNKHELIVYGWQNHHRFYGGNDFTVWEIDRPLKSELHPTMKPIELIERAILNSCKKDSVHERGGIVYDPFLGSGSTLIACEKTKRKCYGMELDPQYVDVIVQRYVDYTGNNKIRLNGEDIEWGDGG